MTVWKGCEQHLVAGDIPSELTAFDFKSPMEKLCCYAALLVDFAHDPIVYPVKDPGNACMTQAYCSGPYLNSLECMSR